MTHLLIVDWTSALFVIDDAFGQHGVLPSFMAYAAARMAGADPPGSGTGFDAAFDDLWSRTTAALPPPLAARAARQLLEYGRAVADEEACGGHPQAPSPARILEIHRIDTALRFYFTLIEAGMGCCLDPAAVAATGTAELAALEHIALVNDLFSYRKEHYAGRKGAEAQPTEAKAKGGQHSGANR
ncbi:hypothetical protein [Nocardia sp. XZ_19_369]|uniref:terpene synthase family protein n=1 Tax=Nocardia sp. XZ_19_369 TaxID=2769487 RepID=UPI0018903FAC|nr:hypothetical protein [Nocardia sp. XZ_19_369]